MNPDHYENFEEQYDDIRKQEGVFENGKPIDIPLGITFAWDFVKIP